MVMNECGRKMRVWSENASMVGKYECVAELLSVSCLGVSVVKLSVRC